MAGADRKSRYDLEQWKRALLSRDFDLVHTQLLMLDGDVSPTERAQLVREIFTAVQQIEELTTGKKHSPDVEPGNSSEHLREIHPKSKPPKFRRASRPKHREDSEEPYEPNPKRRARHVDSPKLPRNRLGKRFIVCPVCGTSAVLGPKTNPRSDWFCNSCRLFKMRLERKHARGRELPTCDHDDGSVSGCKGCRRFKLQEFWFEKKSTPYSIPLIGQDEPSSDSELST